MSIDEHEAWEEEWQAALYDEVAAQATAHFEFARLRSYYFHNRTVAQPALDLLTEARSLLTSSPRSGLILATAATEVGLKAALLRPIVSGLVHGEAMAGLVSDMVVAHQAIDRFRSLLFAVLNDLIAIDLTTFKRNGTDTPLWDEIQRNQQTRNRAVHRGDSVSTTEAELAIAVASVVLEEVFPQVVSALQFHIHDGYRICDEFHLPEELQKAFDQLAAQPEPTNEAVSKG